MIDGWHIASSITVLAIPRFLVVVDFIFYPTALLNPAQLSSAQLGCRFDSGSCRSKLQHYVAPPIHIHQVHTTCLPLPTSPYLARDPSGGERAADECGCRGRGIANAKAREEREGTTNLDARGELVVGERQILCAIPPRSRPWVRACRGISGVALCCVARSAFGRWRAWCCVVVLVVLVEGTGHASSYGKHGRCRVIKSSDYGSRSR